MEHEYYHIPETEFIELLEEFVNTLGIFIPHTKNSYIYEDTIIKIHLVRYFYSEKHLIVRVDRKPFHNSKDELLRKYPNIIMAKGKYPGKYPEYTSIVRYSYEAGYVVPHMINMIYNKEYRMEEQMIYVLEN